MQNRTKTISYSDYSLLTKNTLNDIKQEPYYVFAESEYVDSREPFNFFILI